MAPFFALLAPLPIAPSQKPSLVFTDRSDQVVLPPEPREFRGAWVATVDNIDWPSKKGLTTSALKSEIDAIVDKASELKLNALVFQVRPAADALYPSKLEPWAEWITGTQGQGPKDGKSDFDPLAYMIHACHSHAIELHAWFNPYRAWHPASRSAPASNQVSVAHPDWTKSYGNYKWLDPGRSDVADWTLKVVNDVVNRYDLDGVHIDDYFYPYPIKGQDFPDSDSYADYQKHHGKLDRHAWRRDNTDAFVHNLYTEVKHEKPWVKVGISPFGIYRPGIPAGIQASTDQYDGLYADAKKWLNEGWCDYFAPQLYWKLSQTQQAYSPLLNWWVSQNVMGRQIWPGNFTSRLTENNWPAQEIVDEIACTRNTRGATGNIHFSMITLMNNVKSLDNLLEAGPYSGEALVPACPWLDTAPLSKPRLSLFVNSETATAIFEAKSLNLVECWATWRRYGANWVFHVVPRDQTRWVFAAHENGQKLTACAVAAVDRAEVSSPYAIWSDGGNP